MRAVPWGRQAAAPKKILHYRVWIELFLSE